MPPLCRGALHAAADLVFPVSVACALCGVELDQSGQALCAGCQKQMPPVQGVVCPGCGRGCTGEERLCRMCRTYGEVADRSFAAHDYVDTARGLMIAFKFNDRTGLRVLFAHGMARAVREGGAHDCIDCVVPVPMHWMRQFSRGYNQSALLAGWVARLLGKPYVRGALKRPVHTRTVARTAHGPQQRMQIALGSYGPGRGDFTGKTVLLVDDILTTGATLRACVAILKNMGARQVVTVVAAAVPD